MNDPFGTAGIRDRVLAGWVAAAVRLREDANAEEDLVTGGYRERLVVELAQNAADAAARSGTAGVLSLTLRGQASGPPVLVAANTGEPLTAPGVESLATLRASAKPEDSDSVGRFGVGFASVLAVTDEPAVLSRTGGVRFSRSDTSVLVAQAAAEAPALAQEVRRRGGHLPVLRLPFPAEGSAPEGFDTAVVLALRDEAAADLVREQLADLDDALLLALPWLERVEVDVDGQTRTLSDAAARWHVVRRSGRWTDAERDRLFADRPSEERRQTGWQVLWALPRGDLGTAGLVHAPTPTDEPLSVPGLLLASFPLDPTRRHVAAGPLTARLVGECAEAYAALLAELAQTGADITSFVPTGLAAGALDAALREAILDRLPRTPLLRSVQDPDQLLRGRDAVRVDVDSDDPDVLAVLGQVVAGLVPAPRPSRAALNALGVQQVGLSEVIEALPCQGEPSIWRARYAGLATLAGDPNGREMLALLPVPLVDGRVVRGARGALLLHDDQVDASALAALAPYGLRVVHPQAAHPLLGRLGAISASARTVLEQPAVRAAVQTGADDGTTGEAGTDDNGVDIGRVRDGVLTLLRAALQDRSPVAGDWADGQLTWLSELLLPDSAGALRPAGTLARPDSAATRLLDPDDVAVLDPGLAAAWPPEVLTAVGVLGDLGRVQVLEVEVDDLPELLADLADLDAWCDELGAGSLGEFSAVRDLDLVRPDMWPEALQHIACVPALRRALVEPVRVGTAGGNRLVPSYTAWWLRRQLGTTGLLDPDAPQWLAALLDPAPAWVAALDEPCRRALGLVSALDADPDADLDAGAGAGTGAVAGAGAGAVDLAVVVLQRLGSPDLALDVPTYLRAWAFLGPMASRLDLEAPGQVRVLDGSGTRLVAAEEALVADDPRWLQRPDLGGLVVVAAEHAEAVADLLDLPLASDLAPGVVGSLGEPADVPGVVMAVLAGAAPTWFEHDHLLVDGVEVDWWVQDGQVHAATSDGLARGLAWAADEWPTRHLLGALLAQPGDVVRLIAEDAAG